MKYTALFVFIIFTSGCITIGPDYGPAEKFCKSQKTEFKSGNPIYFTCKDGTKWKRTSHKWFDFQGRE